ncbi:PREDICTED: cdc42 effector protein 1-like [Poecilia mexicana]|uniref:cdc42 effector protein 1-like n=1 Tax=Poecilia mexicana TaxID=48701 RepID=UPI00072EADDD|nr:PREDICTED: cdc42 effector protein 1-like [Poecilia mexicana]
MSLGKLPGIKGLVSGSQGKRRFKSDLSVDMISPPLGDFRHTMHVGRGGDVFGDTSFLSNYGGIQEPGSPDSSSSSKSTGFFTRTFRHVRRTSVPRPRSGSRDLSSPPPDISPIIKNAISLPQLNIDSVNGCLQRALFPNSMGSADDSFCTYGVQSGFLTLPRVSRLERQIQDGDVWRTSPADNGCGALTRSDSLASFTVDLGPSLMTEVLALIDNPSSLQVSNHRQEVEEEEEEEDRGDTSSLTETPVQTPTASSPNPSQCSASFRSKVNGRVMSTWREQKEDWGSVRTNDVTSCSSHKEESSIEAERFQRAADVLARHYGGGSFTRGTRTSQKTPHGLSEEEEEIKV